MKLNLNERLAIFPILPKEGDFTVLRIVKDLQEKVGLGEEDHKTYEIKRFNAEDKEVPFGDSTAVSSKWNSKLAEEVYLDIDLGDKAKEIVRSALLELDKEKKLTTAHLTVYEKFVQDKEDKNA